MRKSENQTHGGCVTLKQTYVSCQLETHSSPADMAEQISISADVGGSRIQFDPRNGLYWFPVPLLQWLVPN